MKIYTTKTLDNGVCVASVRTEDFSVSDQELMADFGEPETNIGGLFTTGVQALVLGNVNMASGYDFSATSPKFTLVYCGGDTETITLSLNCANLAAVLAHIQSQIDIAFGAGVFEAVASTNYVSIQTASAGASFSMVIGAGSPDALTILGITAGTYSGSGADDFTLANNLVRVKSDTPFVAKFDSRDTSLSRAKVMGDIWSTEIVARIEDAMDTLRASTDTFTDESMITY